MLNRKGSSLLELSIVIFILGLLIVGGINFHIAMVKHSQEDMTKEKLKKIEEAIKIYTMENGYLPCPANISYIENSQSSFGKEMRKEGIKDDECYSDNSTYYTINSEEQKIMYGSVPVKDLKLSYDYYNDYWGREITYIVDLKYTTNNSFKESGGKSISITDIKGKTFTKSAIYILFSAGINGNGAYKMGNQLLIDDDEEDANNSISKFKNIFIKNMRSTGFDDLIIYKEKKDFVVDMGLDNIPCTLSDLKLDTNWDYEKYDGCSNDACPQGTEIPRLTLCQEDYVSRNYLKNKIGYYVPSKKCLKYGKWSGELYSCEAGCKISTLKNIVDGGFSVNYIDVSKMMRIPKNEDVTVQCINGKIGYIILSCESDGSWKYNSGICVDDENFVE